MSQHLSEGPESRPSVSERVRDAVGWYADAIVGLAATGMATWRFELHNGCCLGDTDILTTQRTYQYGSACNAETPALRRRRNPSGRHDSRSRPWRGRQVLDSPESFP